MTIQSTRYCELCERDERCHCPAVKSWCDRCCPPRPVQPVYDGPRVPLVARLMA